MQKTLARCIKHGNSDTKILNLCFRNLSEHACFKARHFFQLFVGMTCEPTDIVSPRNMTASRLRQAASRIEPGGNVAPFFCSYLGTLGVFIHKNGLSRSVTHIKHAFFLWKTQVFIAHSKLRVKKDILMNYAFSCEKAIVQNCLVAILSSVVEVVVGMEHSSGSQIFDIWLHHFLVLHCLFLMIDTVSCCVSETIRQIETTPDTLILFFSEMVLDPNNIRLRLFDRLFQR